MDDVAPRFSLQDFVGYFVPGILTLSALLELLLRQSKVELAIEHLGAVPVGVLLASAGYAIGVIIGAATRPLIEDPGFEKALKSKRISEEQWDKLQDHVTALTDLPRTNLSRRHLIRIAREFMRETVPRSFGEVDRLFALGMLARNLIVPSILWAFVTYSGLEQSGAVWRYSTSFLLAVVVPIILFLRSAELRERWIRNVVSSCVERMQAHRERERSRA